jgi:hypothetical protein
MGTRVLGGARSGKTRWAQQFAEKFERVAYVANLMAAAEADPSSAEGRIEEFLAELRTTSSSIVLVSREVQRSGATFSAGPTISRCTWRTESARRGYCQQCGVDGGGISAGAQGEYWSAAMIAFMVAGTESGVGKMTVALALMAALREHGYRVQPFKCGPDFLDTGHQSAICGRTSRNLDTWMLNSEANRVIFASASRDADAAVVEGAMGLYDGASAGRKREAQRRSRSY